MSLLTLLTCRDLHDDLVVVDTQEIASVVLEGRGVTTITLHSGARVLVQEAPDYLWGRIGKLRETVRELVRGYEVEHCPL